MTARLRILVYRDGTTILVTEEQLTPADVEELRAAWARATASGVVIIPEAAVELLEADFRDGGVDIR